MTNEVLYSILRVLNEINTKIEHIEAIYEKFELEKYQVQREEDRSE